MPEGGRRGKSGISRKGDLSILLLSIALEPLRTVEEFVSGRLCGGGTKRGPAFTLIADLCYSAKPMGGPRPTSQWGSLHAPRS